MIVFNKEQIQEIEKLCLKNEVVKILWEDYQTYLTDPAKLYYTALTEAIVDLSLQIKNKTIDVEDAYTKSILRLSETGDKVFNTLDRGKQEIMKSMEAINGIDEDKEKKIKKGKDIAI